MNISATIKGGQIPSGKVRVSGAKNAATKILAASLISDGTLVLENFPTELVDARQKIDFINDSGGIVEVDNELERLQIDPNNFSCSTLAHYNYAFRTTYLLVPGLVKRSGKARIPYPGGCKIGQRGYDLHMMVWEQLGAKVTEHNDFIEVVAEKGFISGQTIDFPISTIGGTENALICAAIVDGETKIKNAYISPEVHSLIDFLISMGVEIEVVGNSFIRVVGNKFLRGSKYTIIPDRIEALTWIVYGVLSGGSIIVEDVPFDTMEIPLLHLKNAGIDLYRNSRNVIVSPDCLVNGVLQPFELATGTHPGIISDMQPFYVLLALKANGISRIHDYRYPERIKYCEELAKFYPGVIDAGVGEIKVSGRRDITSSGANADSTDLRGSMAVLLAALLSQGDSSISNVQMALRGYNKLQAKLEKLGVYISID